jgi:hypothetical protein
MWRAYSNSDPHVGPNLVASYDMQGDVEDQVLTAGSLIVEQ